MIAAAKKPWLWIALTSVAVWPVFVWWAERAIDGSDEPWGIAALALLIGSTLFNRSESFEFPYKTVALLLAGYAATFAFVPNLVRGIFAAAVFGAIVSSKRGTGRAHFGTWGLAAMTLPWLASLQFFLGYPLRVITTELSVRMLRLSGLPITVDGLALNWGPVSVWVDAPCSGVRMLWVGVFLAAALSFLFRLRNSATILLFFLSLVATVLGNVARATSVFYIEAGIFDVPHVFHALTGVVAFAIICAVMVSAAFSLRRFDVSPPPNETNRTPVARIVTLVCCIVGFFVPLVTPPSGASNAIPFPGFPSQFDGEHLTPRALSERDKPYLAGFPGEISAFTTPTYDVLLRWVHSPTRRLHSAADCYRGLGYEVEPLQASDGWARFRAEKEGSVVTFEERIEDANGKHYQDVGAWYWAAKLGQTHGPWWNVVRVER